MSGHTEWTGIKLRAALERSNGSIAETARRLGVTRKTIYRWMKKYGIERTTMFLKVPDAE